MITARSIASRAQSLVGGVGGRGEKNYGKCF